METSISEEPIALDHLVPSRHQHRLKRRPQRSGRAKDHLCTSARPSPHTGTPLSRHCALGGEASSTHTASSITQRLYNTEPPRSQQKPPPTNPSILHTTTSPHQHCSPNIHNLPPTSYAFHCMGTMIDITRIKILPNQQRKHTPFRPLATPLIPTARINGNKHPTPPPSQSQPNSSAPTFSSSFSFFFFFSSPLTSSHPPSPSPSPPLLLPSSHLPSHPPPRSAQTIQTPSVEIRHHLGCRLGYHDRDFRCLGSGSGLDGWMGVGSAISNFSGWGWGMGMRDEGWGMRDEGEGEGEGEGGRVGMVYPTRQLLISPSTQSPSPANKKELCI